MNIEIIHEENMNYIRVLGAAALAEGASKWDTALAELGEDHYFRMQKLDYDFERRQQQRDFLDAISPFSTIGEWFDNQPLDYQDGWQDTYQEYQYGPLGDRAIGEDNYFAYEVMSLLKERDSYLKLPFCPYCDSRGHKSGECMTN
jgi:hypothetical protein